MIKKKAASQQIERTQTTKGLAAEPVEHRGGRVKIFCDDGLHIVQGGQIGKRLPKVQFKPLQIKRLIPVSDKARHGKGCTIIR